MSKAVKIVSVLAGCVLLCVSGVASATDVPIVGVTSGHDGELEPLLEYLKAASAIAVDAPGYTILSSSEVAALLEARGEPARDDPSMSEALGSLGKAELALSETRYQDAIEQLEAARAELALDGGARVAYGSHETWLRVHELLATAYVMPKNEKSRDEDAAREIFAELLLWYPDFELDAGAYPEHVLEVFRDAQEEASALLRGALTVTSSAGLDVYVNGFLLGASEEAITLFPGSYEVQVAEGSVTSRIYRAQVRVNERTELEIDWGFESRITTRGDAIYVTGGASPASVALELAGGVARHTPYAEVLVFGVASVQPLTFYAALVNGRTGIVIHEQRETFEPGPVDTSALSTLLRRALDGDRGDDKEADAWPWYRTGWIITGSLALAFVGVGTYFTLDGAAELEAGEARDQFTDEAVAHEEAATTSYIVGSVMLGLAAVALGLTAWFIYGDVTWEPPTRVDFTGEAPRLTPFVSPVVDRGEVSGGVIGLDIAVW